jgi:hypothetical protein
MNVLSILATLGQLAAAIDNSGSGANSIDSINAFARSPNGQKIIGLVDQLLAEVGLELAITTRKPS